MNSLHVALRALRETLESQVALDATVASLERGLARAFAADVVAIDLYEHPVALRRAEADGTFALVLDARTFGTVRFGLSNERINEQRDAIEALLAPLAAGLAWRTHASERNRLHELVRTDALTRLANRMAFDERLDDAWQRTRERDLPLTLALLDVDYFKAYNDIYGHLDGDDCLRSVAALLASEADRENAFVARYGGEEFALIFECAESRALGLIADMFAALEARSIPHEGSTLGRISISVGIASTASAPFASIAAFVLEADRELYRAKALGRNRACAGEYVSSGPVVSRHARTLADPALVDDATVGRDADLTRVLAALRQSRLVSLVGVPGVGKSRLARTAASKAQFLVADGVAYVDFARLGPNVDPSAAICAALDVAIESRDIREGLMDAVKERETLLVLDNVAPIGARLVASLCDDLLAAAPSLCILATSCVALGCAQERTVVVASLGEEAALELLHIRSGSGDTAALRTIVREAGGLPSNLEAAARRLRTGAGR